MLPGMDRDPAGPPARGLGRIALEVFARQPHLAFDRAWLAGAVDRLPAPDRELVRRVAAGADLDGLARELGVSRGSFDARWAALLAELARVAHDEGALRRGQVGEHERSLARVTAAALRARGLEVGLRGASIAATAPDRRRLAIEGVAAGRWALEAAIGEARARTAVAPGVQPGIVIDAAAERVLRKRLTQEPESLAHDLMIFVVEGAFVAETTAARIVAPWSPPRGPFAGRP